MVPDANFLPSFISATPFVAMYYNDPEGIRTPVAGVKDRCPGPLDDGAVSPTDDNYRIVGGQRGNVKLSGCLR
jgi:hypothetical protein